MTEIYYDLETTGTNVETDRIVQIAAIKMVDGIEKKRLNIILNPSTPIPTQASDVHRITDEMVKNRPTFKDVGMKLFRFFDGCILVGYNSINFDTPLLKNEFNRLGLTLDIPSEIDSYQIWNNMEKNKKLSDAYKRFCHREMDETQAHDALYDIEITMKVINSQKIVFNTYSKSELADISKPMNNKIVDGVMMFGKFKGKTIEWVKSNEQQYVTWLLNSDIDEKIKKELS